MNSQDINKLNPLWLNESGKNKARQVFSLYPSTIRIIKKNQDSRNALKSTKIKIKQLHFSITINIISKYRYSLPEQSFHLLPKYSTPHKMNPCTILFPLTSQSNGDISPRSRINWVKIIISPSRWFNDLDPGRST